MFATAWGLIEKFGGLDTLDSTISAIVPKLKSLGYAGLEMPIAFAMKYGSAKFLALLESNEMLYIAQVFTSAAPPTPGNLDIPSEHGIVHLPDSSSTRDVERHKAVLEAQVRVFPFHLGCILFRLLHPPPPPRFPFHLGCILFRVATFLQPFTASSPTSLFPPPGG